ncbi:hypothetical protein CCP3SC15_4030004 [Gammaproteobacteria bacterium]
MRKIFWLAVILVVLVVPVKSVKAETVSYRLVMAQNQDSMCPAFRDEIFAIVQYRLARRGVALKRLSTLTVPAAQVGLYDKRAMMDVAKMFHSQFRLDDDLIPPKNFSILVAPPWTTDYRHYRTEAVVGRRVAVVWLGNSIPGSARQLTRVWRKLLRL